MTNNQDKHNNQDHNQEQCEVCKLYKVFTSLLTRGISQEDAYHYTMTSLAEELIEEIYEISMEEAFDKAMNIGYSEGYVEALNTVSEQTRLTAERLEDALDADMGCSCDTCTCQTVEDIDSCEKDCGVNESSVDDTPIDFAKWMKERMGNNE